MIDNLNPLLLYNYTLILLNYFLEANENKGHIASTKSNLRGLKEKAVDCVIVKPVVS